MKNLKLLSIAGAIFGIVMATLLVAWFGFVRVADAILAIGGCGFAFYGFWQILLFALMGVAWWAIVPSGQGRTTVLIWGRMVRDSAASCLPFSQLGGFVLGARAIALHGVSPPVATISTVVDLTAEFVAEVLFLAIGLVILLAHRGGMGMTPPILLGLAAVLVVGVLGMRHQHQAATLFVRFGRRLLGQWFANGADGQPIPEAELKRMYGNADRLAAGTALHLAGWFGKGIGDWIAFLLLGAQIDLSGALAIEALLHAMLAAAFFVPGYAGVQEAGYAGLGAVFGIPPEIGLAASLLRRARDLAVGVPILLIWQFLEVRRLRSATARQ